MKCNYKKRIQDEPARRFAQTQGTVKRLWELATLLTLHREFGFGKGRLIKFAKALADIYREITFNASRTDAYDKKRRELTDINTAIIMVLRELRADGIDHREILGNDEQLIIVEEDGSQKNLDDVLDKIQDREESI